MTLAEFKTQLAQNPDLSVRFRFADGESVPAHAHVTEVARIDKQFVDCGGTFRTQSMCRLQTWVSDDYDHRLKAGVLLKILEKGGSFLQTEDIEVDVEHELDYITQFPIASVGPNGEEMIVELSERHTDCLAKEKCCAPTPKYESNPMKLHFKETPA
jgi:hypothetical protein